MRGKWWSFEQLEQVFSWALHWVTLVFNIVTMRGLAVATTSAMFHFKFFMAGGAPVHATNLGRHAVMHTTVHVCRIFCGDIFEKGWKIFNS